MHRHQLRKKLFVVDRGERLIALLQGEWPLPHLKTRAIFSLEDHVDVVNDNHMADQCWDFYRIAAGRRYIGELPALYGPSAHVPDVVVASERAKTAVARKASI
jgi:hypothetical protein